jgi:uncharacterized protein (TIGR02145 family)
MNQIKKVRQFGILALILMSCSQDASVNESTIIKEVKIGNQIWMGENLNVDRFQNGDPILQAATENEWLMASDNEQPAWCYYKNDPANGEKYGKLYNWYAINDSRGLAPKGWHVPSDVEWTQLIDFLGGENVAGAKLKSKSGWDNNGNGTNESGFNGLPGGNRNLVGDCGCFGTNGYWWSSTEYFTVSAWNRFMGYGSSIVYRGSYNKGTGFSVRCVKD